MYFENAIKLALFSGNVMLNTGQDFILMVFLASLPSLIYLNM